MIRTGSFRLALLLAFSLAHAMPASAQSSPDPLDDERDIAQSLFEAAMRSPEERTRARRETMRQIERLSFLLFGEKFDPAYRMESWLPLLEAEAADARTAPDRLIELWHIWDLARRAHNSAESKHLSGGAAGIRLEDVMRARALELQVQLRLARLNEEKALLVSHIASPPLPSLNGNLDPLDELAAMARAKEETLRRTPAEMVRERHRVARMVSALRMRLVGEKIDFSDSSLINALSTELAAAAELSGNKELTPALLKRLWECARLAEDVTEVKHRAGGVQGIKFRDVLRTRTARLSIEIQLVRAYESWPGERGDSLNVIAVDLAHHGDDLLDQPWETARKRADAHFAGVRRLEQAIVESAEREARLDQWILENRRFLPFMPSEHRLAPARIAVARDRAEILSLWTSHLRLALREEALLRSQHLKGEAGTGLSEVLEAKLRRLQIEARLAVVRDRK